MASNTAFRITEIDAQQIKANLKDFLRQQSEFTDFDFEGSGMNILLDLLAYNTHYMAFYTNMLGSEAYHDTAQLRNSLVSHAKHIGYTPGSVRPASSIVTIKVTPSDTEDTDATTLTLPKWTSFRAQAIDGINYNFVTVNSNVATKTANTFTFNNVVLKQAEVISRTFLVASDNPKREYYIPSSNVDTNELYVTVQQSTTNTSIEVYTQYTDLTALRSNSLVYFVEESTTGNGHYKILFGDGYLGKKPSDGNIVTITYLDSDGPKGNGANSFVLVNSINGFNDNVQIITSAPSAGGSDRETIEEIRYRAPRSYTTQNRAVVADDYKSLLLRDYPNIQSVAVWGGEEYKHPVYGKVFISLKPKTNYYITNVEKDEIIKNIIKNHSVMTVIPEIINPDYTYLLVSAKVFYDKTKTTRDDATMKSLIRNAILTYRNNNLQKFDSKFRISQLQREIENVDPAINSATVKLFVQKRIVPTLTTSINYEADFKIALDKDELYSNPSFLVNDAFGVERTVFIEEVPQSYTGLDHIDVITSGNDYEDAIVTISGDGAGATATAKIINRKIDSINLENRGSNYTKAIVSITSNTGYGATATSVLQFQNGVLRTFYYKTNGEKVIVNETAGTIDYKNGVITLDGLIVNSVTDSDNYNDDIIAINIRPSENDISSIRNAILDLDENDANSIQISLVEE